MIFISCPHCQAKLKVKDEAAGRRLGCPFCHQVVVIRPPKAALVAAETKAIQVAAGAPVARPYSEDATLPPMSGRYDATLPPATEPLGDTNDNTGVTVAPPPQAIPLQAMPRQALPQQQSAAADGDATIAYSNGQAAIELPQNNRLRYQVENEIARGGMGAVMRAVDQDISREVALKFLLKQDDPRHKARFIEEAKITGQLEHPNIVPIHDLGIDGDGQLYFSMKMVKGRSLAAILQPAEPGKNGSADCTLGRLLTVFSNVCNALAYAHSRGVIHRDLKPANIMVGDFGEVYVMDWGLAKALPGAGRPQPDSTLPDSAISPPSGDSHSPLAAVVTGRSADSDLTQDGAVMGTPAYMPPEQARGQAQAVDQRSDIYSLGAILYEMLTLTPPVGRGGDFMAVLMRVAEGAIDAPEKRAPERVRQGWIPPELSAIAMKALAKAPDQRYQTVAALKRDIELYLEGRSVSAKHDTAWETFRKLVKRNKGASIGVGVALLVLLASLGFIFRAWLETGRAYAAYRDQVGKSLPAFLKAAHLAVEQRQFDDALEQVELALATAPGEAAPRLLKGQLLMVKQNFPAAENELNEFLRAQPADEHARKLQQLCQQAQPDDVNQLLRIAAVFYEQKIYGLIDLLLHKYGKDSNDARQFLLKMYRERIEKSWKGRGNNLTIDVSGLQLSLSKFGDLTDLSPLKGMPLTSLSLNNCGQVRNLAPLHGMPLANLNLTGSQVADLSPLKGAPLTTLSCAGLPVADLMPLKGMRLTSLDLTGCTLVRDLAPLKGMPLTYLNISNSKIDDLGPLRGMKLTTLDISNCAQVRDLTPLQGMQLNTLNLTGCTQLQTLMGLQDMPLTSLTLKGCVHLQELTPLQGLKLTYLNLMTCSQLRDLTGLQGMPLTSLNLSECTQLQNLRPLQDLKLNSLTLSSCTQLRDLTPLQGMQLTSLELYGCSQLRSLAGLQGMPLTSLGLRYCSQLQDVTPLQGMKFTSLNFESCTQLRDLSGLQGMPLTSLVLLTCPQVRDLTPLHGMPLTDLNLNGTKVQDLAPLEGMKLTFVDLRNCPFVQDLTALHGMKFTSLDLTGCVQLRDLTGLEETKLISLKLADCAQVRDLTPLRGIPLTSLNISGCAQVRSLAGLEEMPLTSLNLLGCIQVRDLAPLKGLELTNLQLENCREIRDLTPLKGMPLTTLNLIGSGVQDLTPLAGMNLQYVYITPKAISSGIEALRSMKGLEKIMVVSGTSGLAPDAFWRKYDAKEFSK